MIAYYDLCENIMPQPVECALDLAELANNVGTDWYTSLSTVLAGPMVVIIAYGADAPLGHEGTTLIPAGDLDYLPEVDTRPAHIKYLDVVGWAELTLANPGLAVELRQQLESS